MAKKRRKRLRRRVREMQPEVSYVCDACGEEIVIPVDPSQGDEQSYVEDCPVCCRPNIVHLDIEPDGSVRAWAEPE
ncbi:CPXCG motif-containing cysteine-rich protein [Anatilimnocola sp. NA78]|uniref:CPXCG motif-containing cysteine-rich protein n=1 Tax=Anatilimnocola sp. NA78 TaxID=3415683 RepID=UPI003CE46F6B